MTSLEDTLREYKEPSSQTEQDKQERSERMVRGAISGWSALEAIGFRILVKGSYVNNTNVRTDSDVDIAVIHKGFHYYDDSELPPRQRIKPESITCAHYDGAEFRAELEKALQVKFGSQCDTSGKTAIAIRESSSRVGVDVVPSFEFRKYYYDFWWGRRYHQGTKTRRIDGSWIVNFPEQQLENGRTKNRNTNGRYKHQVRILKRIENELVEAGRIAGLPSYFMECLVYNVPDNKLRHSWSDTPLTAGFRDVLAHIYHEVSPSWLEPNGIKQLFGDGQPWSITDAKELTQAAWNRYKLGD